jgi:prevent-host-death family protein
MKRFAITKLKSYLSQYLSEVKEGEELLDTSKGKTKARIVPVELREQSIEQLEQWGIVKTGKKSLPVLSPGCKKSRRVPRLSVSTII